MPTPFQIPNNKRRQLLFGLNDRSYAAILLLKKYENNKLKEIIRTVNNIVQKRGWFTSAKNDISLKRIQTLK